MLGFRSEATDSETEASGVGWRVSNESTGELKAENGVKEKLADIRSTLDNERRPSITDVIQKHTGRTHPLIWVGIGLASLQQLTRINVVFYYGRTSWQATGFTEASALSTNVVNGSVNVVFTLVAIALIDRVGRRPLLLVGSIGQAFMLGTMAYVFATAAQGGASGIEMQGGQGIVALVAANAYIAFFVFFLETSHVGYARGDASKPIPRRSPLDPRPDTMVVKFLGHVDLPYFTRVNRAKHLLRYLCGIWDRNFHLREVVH